MHVMNPSSTAMSYLWRTDAASGEIMASSPEEALSLLRAYGEWAPTAERERRDVANGSWLLIGVKNPGATCPDWILQIGNFFGGAS